MRVCVCVCEHTQGSGALLVITTVILFAGLLFSSLLLLFCEYFQFPNGCTVHDTENLTFSRNSIVVPRRHLQIVVRYNTDLPQGSRESSAQADTNLPQFGLQMAETRRQTSCTTMLKDRGRHHKDCSNYHCRNRAPFDLSSIHFTMIFSMESLRLSTG